MPDGGDFAQQRVCDVPIHHLPVIWPLVEHFIAAALDLDECERFLPIDIYKLLIEGRGRLWVSWDRQTREFEAAAVTEIIQYPRCRECRVWLVGGRNMRAWSQEFQEMVEGYARGAGCDHMASSGRRGAVRVAGYKQVGFDLIKRLG
jgi:hypothetical protein